jgi:hypothetical protein
LIVISVSLVFLVISLIRDIYKKGCQRQRAVKDSELSLTALFITP